MVGGQLLRFLNSRSHGMGRRDRRKLTFYFIADKRIDFRELVRELFRYVSGPPKGGGTVGLIVNFQGVQDENLAVCSVVERGLRAVKRSAVVRWLGVYGPLGGRSVC